MCIEADPLRSSHLRIFQYDIAKRQGTLLTEATTTPGFLSSLCIRQNYIILPYAQVSTAVLDWKSGKYLCLDFVDAEVRHLPILIVDLTYSHYS